MTMPPNRSEAVPEALAVAQQLREQCEVLRMRPIPLNHMIPLMQQAADLLSASPPPPSPEGGEGASSKQQAHPFGWLFEGPEGLRQFTKAQDFTKPVLDLHRRMAQEQPDKYTLTALYAAALRPEGKEEQSNG